MRPLIFRLPRKKVRFYAGGQLSNSVQAFCPQIAKANVGTLMVAVQVQKAIEKADTNAFNIFMNKAFGMPEWKYKRLLIK